MSLIHQHIVIFSQMQFDHLESTPYTLAKHLAKDNHVYFVDRPYTIKDYFSLRKTDAFKTRRPHFFSAHKSYLQSDLPNLKIIICPPVLSINALPEGRLYRLLSRFNEWMVSSRLKTVLKDFKADKYVFINSYNFSYPQLHKKMPGATLTAYHCVDPIIGEYQLKHGIMNEDLLVKSVGLVICTSKELARQKALLNKNTFFIPNAANISHSRKALDPALPVSAMFLNIRRPVIGYFGAIERRIDYDLMKKVIAQNPNKSFVFAGPVDEQCIKMNAFTAPNLYLTGQVPYEQMPAVLKGFDVAIIPFKKDAVSSHIFPLKLFEYLGAGKPIVSTNFNTDLKDFTHNLVPYCRTAEEFSKALNLALSDTLELQQQRLKIAADNTWEHRAADIKKVLAANLKSEKHSRVLVLN